MVITFISGVIAGGTLGILIMCLFQINHNKEEENDNRQIYTQKQKK